MTQQEEERSLSGMPTLGEELKRKREERGITLTDIAEATRIGTRFLKAIETNNFSVLPGGIFTRSFIRSFAKEVGMNQDEAISLYHQQVADASPSGPLEPVEQIDTPSPSGSLASNRSSVASRTSWPSVVIAGGIVVFLVIVVLALVKQLNRSSDETPPPVIVRPQPRDTAQAAAQDPRETPDSGLSTTPLIVQLEATSGECWIRFQVDDEPPSSLTLRPGDVKDLPPAESQIRLNIGNRQPLQIRINDQVATLPADTPTFRAQVTISRDNLGTFFP